MKTVGYLLKVGNGWNDVRSTKSEYFNCYDNNFERSAWSHCLKFAILTLYSLIINCTIEYKCITVTNSNKIYFIILFYYLKSHCVMHVSCNIGRSTAILRIIHTSRFNSDKELKF